MFHVKYQYYHNSKKKITGTSNVHFLKQMKHITIPSSILSKCVTCIREKCPGTTTITIMYTDLLLFFLNLFLFRITNAYKEELNHQLTPFQ